MKSLKLLIPSILSSFRLVAALIFPFASEASWLWLIVAAAVSDALDGWLARRWQAVSWQGGLIDAVSDKLFVLTVLIVYAVNGKLAPLWIPAIISRDLLVLCTVIYIIAARLWRSFQEMDARVLGKVATGGQFVLFFVVAAVPDKTMYALLFASLCSAIAAIDYGLLFGRALAARFRGRR